MVKRVNLTAAFSLVLIALSTAYVQAQVVDSKEAKTDSTSSTSKRFSFFLSWDGKRLGVIAESRKKHAQSNSGVVVKDLIKDTTADRAGIKIGDIITEIDGHTIKTFKMLRNEIALLDYGKEYMMKITRGGASQDIKFTLEETADNDAYYNYYGDQAAQALKDLQDRIKKNSVGSKPIRSPKEGFAEERKHNKLGVSIQTLNDQLSQF